MSNFQVNECAQEIAQPQVLVLVLHSFKRQVSYTWFEEYYSIKSEKSEINSIVRPASLFSTHTAAVVCEAFHINLFIEVSEN